MRGTCLRFDSGHFVDGSYLSDDEGNDDDIKPVWPTWAVGALFRGARRYHINRVCFHIITPRL